MREVGAHHRGRRLRVAAVERRTAPAVHVHVDEAGRHQPQPLGRRRRRRAGADGEDPLAVDDDPAVHHHPGGQRQRAGGEHARAEGNLQL